VFYFATVTATETTFTLEFPYRRTVGPVVGAFLTGLREGKILGIKGHGGRVISPPLEYDPDTAEDLTELVEVGPGGVVGDWNWVAEPLRKHPLDRPFAWALIKLDGADTTMLHAVDAGSIERMSRGMRVTATFADERKGRITDIACFEPEEG
jgi:uncharacterized OB-fold protein